jgi:tetratricopeptide (TPR) repeat protein
MRCTVTHDEAQRLQIAGKYSELLRSAVAEQIRACNEGKLEEELRWTLWAAKACRYLGRTYEGIAHAAHGVLRAQSLGRRDLLAEAVYTQALMFKGAARLPEALDALDRAVGLLPEDASEFTRAVFHLERAELALEARRLAEARASLARSAARVQWLENARLLAWTMYLRALIEEPAQSVSLLTGALGIAESITCPELEWQIHWRLADGMALAGGLDAEERHARRAFSILKTMAQPLANEDLSAFWRQGARARFLRWCVDRFGPAFQQLLTSSGVQEPAAPDSEMELGWDPSLLPSFVQASARAAS